MANILINNTTNDNNNLVLGKTNHMQVQLYTNAAASGLVASDASGTPNIGIHANGEGGNIRFLSRDKKYHWEMDANNNTTFRLYFGRESSHPDGAYEDYQYFTFNGLDGYISAKGFYGDLKGNASSASLLKPTDNLDTTYYGASGWVPAPVTSNNGIIVWREAFKSDSLPPDTGDIVLWLSGSQQLNLTIDGHFWQDHDAAVLDHRNFTSYVTPHAISALGAKVEFGIWGMKDPAHGDNWIRTTSYGLLPYAHGGIGGSHSALGEAGWWFNNSWIETMHTNVIYFNSDKDDSAYIHTEIHDSITFFDFNLCDDSNDRWRWIGGLYNSNTGNTDWYESMTLTLNGVNNSVLRLNGVFSCNDAHVDNKLYVSSGGIYVNGHQIIRHDGEGTNFNVVSGNGHNNFWEIDSYNGDLRIYTWRESDGEYRGTTLYQEDGCWSNARWARTSDYSTASYFVESSTGSFRNSSLSYLCTSNAFDYANWQYDIIMDHGGDDFRTILQFPYWGSPRYRKKENGNWGNYQDFITSENYTSYCIPANAYISTTTNVGGDAILKIHGRADLGCLLLTNEGWTGYGTANPNDAGLSQVVGRVYFQIQ